MANQYFTCVLDAWRDGKTLYGRMHYYRSGSYFYQDTSFPNPTMNLGGTTYTDTDFGNRVRSGIYVGDVYSTTFSRTVAGTGDRTVTWSAGSGQRSDFAGTWSKTVNFPVEYTAPTGLSISVLEVYPDGGKFNVSISSYGNPSSASDRYVEAQICVGNDYSSTRKYKHATHGASSLTQQITVTNSSYTGGGLNIVANTQYYYGGYATNTQLTTSKIQGQFVTLAHPATITYGGSDSTTAVFTYETKADGGYYSKTLEYSLDNGTTWTTAATIASGAETSGYFIVSGLTGGNTYTLKSRVRTTSGSSNNTDITFTATPEALRDKVYGGVSREIIDSITYTAEPEGAGNILSVNTTTLKNVLNNDTNLRAEMEANNVTFGDLEVLALWALVDPPIEYQILLGFDMEGSGTAIFISEDGQPYSPTDLGLTFKDPLTAGGDYLYLDVTTDTVDESKKVDKFYGRGGDITSVNGTIRTGGAGNITAFDGQTFWNAVKQNSSWATEGIETSGLFTQIILGVDTSQSLWYVNAIFLDGSDTTLAASYLGNTLSEFGITASLTTDGDDIIDITPVYSNYSSREADKLYGPVMRQGITGVSGTIRAGGAGNLVSFDGDTFWETIQKVPGLVAKMEDSINDSYVIEYYPADPANDEVESVDLIRVGQDDQWLSIEGAPFTIAQLGIETSSTIDPSGSDTIDLSFIIGDVVRTRLIHQGFGHLDWGEATYYTGTTTISTTFPTVESDDPNVTINSVDYEKFNQFVQDNDILVPGTIEIVTGGLLTRTWKFPTADGTVDVYYGSRLEDEVGISATLSGYSNTTAYTTTITTTETIPDTTSPTNTVKLLTYEEYNSLAADNPSTCTVGGETVDIRAISNYTFGSTASIVPRNFLKGATNLLSIDMSRCKAKEISPYFLYGCASFNSPVNLPSTVEVIGSGFLIDCTSFNQPFVMPDTVLRLEWSHFLHGCTSFNSSLTLSSSLESLEGYFMYGCTSFNQPFVIPNGVTKITSDFMHGCTSFNQPITLPPSMTSIGGQFMQGCTSFNKPFTIPDTLTQITGGNFFYDCKSMVSPITCNAPTSILGTSLPNNILATSDPNAACYTTGIPLTGTYAQDWHSTLPDSSSSPYRKTVVV